jgi:cholesterol oxidase
LTDTDHMLREIAEDLGRGDTFAPTQVGIYFGEVGKTAPDPYFAGAGPDRSGCTECGACMTGCNHNAKNTLDKNYLYLAERQGARVIPETEVKIIRELPGGGYEVVTRRITDVLFRRSTRYRTRGIVMAGGVLGTVPLLLKCKERGWLPRISTLLAERDRFKPPFSVFCLKPVVVGATGGVSTCLAVRLPVVSASA